MVHVFRCDKCGQCCRNLKKSSLYNSLHNGDGVCRYLENNLCSIYEDRPLLCRVDESYKQIFSHLMTYEQYLKLNYDSCENLKLGGK